MSDDLFSRYPALRDRPSAMALYAGVLRDQGRHDDAFAMADAAVTAAPDDMGIRDTIRQMLSIGVHRFHIPMLHDEVRNRAYARAIEMVVKPGMKVLEIGTGAGLLALLAARAGAAVTTCEEHPMIAAAAKNIVARNGLSDRIRVLSKRSTAVRIPEDMSEPADLLIHEIFGSRMVNEGVVDAMTDARSRLVKPGAPALPPRAWLRCLLADSVNQNSVQADVGIVEGFDLSPFNALGQPTRRTLQPGGKGFTPRSQPVSVLPLDFGSPPPFGPIAQTVTLRSEGGRIDGIVQWLAIGFADGEVLENDPYATDAPLSSWGVPFLPLTQPINTAPGDLIDVTVSHRASMLTMNVVKSLAG